MKLLQTIGRWLGVTSEKKAVRASYEAAGGGGSNTDHWLFADDLGPNGATSSDVATSLRQKARYERRNDGCFSGLGRQLAVDLIGTGPRWQLTGNISPATARRVSRLFARWCKAAEFTEKLRLLTEPRPFDGDVFGLVVNDQGIKDPVKIGLQVIEAEQVASPNIGSIDPDEAVDGIRYDKDGRPSEYYVLYEHPGDATLWALAFTPRPGSWRSASLVLHWFRPDRPGQGRGVCEFAGALNTGAQVRRFKQAVLDKQELGANVVGVIEHQQLPETTPDPGRPFEQIPTPRRGFMNMPVGTKANPFPQASTTDYKQYVHDVTAQLGRPVNAPRNMVTGDSSDFNFASGRMDHLPYRAGVWLERVRLETLLDKLTGLWLFQARKIPGYLPADFDANLEEIDSNWHWDGFPSISPVDDETAREKRLKNGVTNYAIECAAEGYDWEEVFEGLAKQFKRAKELGIDSILFPPPKGVAAPVAGPNDPDEPEEEDDDTALAPNRRAEVARA